MIVGGAIAIWLLISVLALALCRIAALGDGCGWVADVADELDTTAAEPGLAASLLSAAKSPSPAPGA